MMETELSVGATSQLIPLRLTEELLVDDVVDLVVLVPLTAFSAALIGGLPLPRFIACESTDSAESLDGAGSGAAGVLAVAPAPEAAAEAAEAEHKVLVTGIFSSPLLLNSSCCCCCLGSSISAA